MERLKPNTEYKCITHEARWFKNGNTYKTNSNGIILDDEGDERDSLSEPDSFFFDRFEEVKKEIVTEITTDQIEAEYKDGLLLIIDSYRDRVTFSGAGILQLRNFLNQLELGG